MSGNHLSRRMPGTPYRPSYVFGNLFKVMPGGRVSAHIIRLNFSVCPTVFRKDIL